MHISRTALKMEVSTLDGVFCNVVETKLGLSVCGFSQFSSLVNVMCNCMFEHASVTVPRWHDVVMNFLIDTIPCMRSCFHFTFTIDRTYAIPEKLSNEAVLCCPMNQTRKVSCRGSRLCPLSNKAASRSLCCGR